MAFFQNNFSMMPLTKININLHPSSAGIGKRLKTHKFILIIAAMMNINFIPAESEFVIKSTIPIGPLTCSIASCLSIGVSGTTIFFTKLPIHWNVRSD
jgi:hypothetical protein